MCDEIFKYKTHQSTKDINQNTKFTIQKAKEANQNTIQSTKDIIQ